MGHFFKLLTLSKATFLAKFILPVFLLFFINVKAISSFLEDLSEKHHDIFVISSCKIYAFDKNGICDIRGSRLFIVPPLYYNFYTQDLIVYFIVVRYLLIHNQSFCLQKVLRQDIVILYINRNGFSRFWSKIGLYLIELGL